MPQPAIRPRQLPGHVPRLPVAIEWWPERGAGPIFADPDPALSDSVGW